MGATGKLVGKMVRSQMHLRRFSLESAFETVASGRWAAAGSPGAARSRLAEERVTKSVHTAGARH